MYAETVTRVSHSKKEHISYFNIIVAGASNTGKTSFIRTFCEMLKPSTIQGTFRESRPKTLTDTIRCTEEMYTVSMEIEKDDQRTALSFTDTPGLLPQAIMTEQLKAIVNHIDDQFARTLSEEIKPKRNTKAADTQVHACIYFISPNNKARLSAMDKFAIKSLSGRVNVIPVICKADTLTTAQSDALKDMIRKEIFNDHQMRVYGHIDIGEPKNPNRSGRAEEITNLTKVIDVLEECLAEDDDLDVRVMVDYLQAMPYTTISHEEIESKRSNEPTTNSQKTLSAQSQLGRRYPWAFIECSNPDHCDLILLEDMLLSAHMEMLKIDTCEIYYEKYRTQKLLGKQKKQTSRSDFQLLQVASP
ncbi:Septin-type guanine nucleotide-binding (G) domain-containing protein [Sporodiniella umbellata]|nr:Septin-type guanine nucleotide-binding (G) domain-containing protein [Sporodiniella umbellata]